MYKQRNRDTAWFAIIDTDWPKVKTVFETWLDPDNFDSDGRQRTRLSELMSKAGGAYYTPHRTADF